MPRVGSHNTNISCPGCIDGARARFVEAAWDEIVIFASRWVQYTPSFDRFNNFDLQPSESCVFFKEHHMSQTADLQIGYIQKP